MPGPARLLLAALAAASALSARAAVAQPASPPPVAPRAPAAPAAPRSLDALPARFALLDGRRVLYRTAGTGPRTLVLVHGWSCSMELFREQLPLASELRLLLVDLPGHGGSEVPEAPLGMDLFARSVLAAMDAAGVGRAVLAGHSMGAAVVRQVYRRAPERVLGLVSVDGALRPYFTRAEEARAYVAPLEAKDGRAAFLRRVDGMLPPTMPEELRALVRSTMGKTPQAVVVGAAKAMVDLSIWKEDPIGVPLLSILAKSPYWDEGYRAFVRKLQPEAGFVEVEGAGHFLMLERPGPVDDALLRFVAASAR